MLLHFSVLLHDWIRPKFTDVREVQKIMERERQREHVEKELPNPFAEPERPDTNADSELRARLLARRDEEDDDRHLAPTEFNSLLRG